MSQLLDIAYELLHVGSLNEIQMLPLVIHNLDRLWLTEQVQERGATDLTSLVLASQHYGHTDNVLNIPQ